MISVGEIKLDIFETLSEEQCEPIWGPLREYNLRHNPTYFAARELRENQAKGLSILARDSAGNVLGGLIAETQFAWLKISIMAVRENARRGGIGTALLRAAEAGALRRGCRYAFVDTMDYQSPGFYEKLGYQIVGRIPDWDSHGHAKLYLTKILAAAAST